MSLLMLDRALLDAYRAGDPCALERVYRAYAEDVASLLARGFTFSAGARTCSFRGYRDRFDLEDVLQEVFLRAFGERARLAYDGLKPFKSYILGIARNAVIDAYRRNRRASQCFIFDYEMPANTFMDPSESLEEEALVQVVERFRTSLTPEEEQVFRLRFEEGKSLAAVESTTGRSPSKTKTLEKKLRTRLLDEVWAGGFLEGYRQDRRSRNGAAAS